MTSMLQPNSWRTRTTMRMARLMTSELEMAVVMAFP